MLDTYQSEKFYVLSTSGLCRKDRMLLKSICMLLSSRLNKRWLVSSDATCGELQLAYEGALNSTEFERSLFLSATEVTNQDTLHYPIRPQELVTVLNEIKFDSAAEIGSANDSAADTQDSNSHWRDRKRKSLNFFHALLNKKEAFSTRKATKKTNQAALTVERLAQQECQKTRLDSIKKKFNSDAKTLNLVFLGTPGSGKTTSIFSAGDSKVATTEVVAKDSLRLVKQETTVALDYGEVTIDGVKVAMKGTPGQTRFGYMWEIACKHADAFALLVDCNSADVYGDVELYWQAVKKNHSTQPVLLGLTHSDLFDKVEFEHKKFQSIVGDHVRLKISYLDPRSKQSTISFIRSII